MNAMKNIDTLDKNVKGLLVERDVVAGQLNALDFVTKVYASDSNFLLFRVKSKAQEMYKMMADRGVVTRYRGNELHCDECIRVTIGKKEENEQFLVELKKAWAELGDDKA